LGNRCAAHSWGRGKDDVNALGIWTFLILDGVQEFSKLVLGIDRVHCERRGKPWDILAENVLVVVDRSRVLVGRIWTAERDHTVGPRECIQEMLWRVLIKRTGKVEKILCARIMVWSIVMPGHAADGLRPFARPMRKNSDTRNFSQTVVRNCGGIIDSLKVILDGFKL